jgi:hypothetical protein
MLSASKDSSSRPRGFIAAFGAGGHRSRLEGGYPPPKLHCSPLARRTSPASLNDPDRQASETCHEKT